MSAIGFSTVNLIRGVNCARSAQWVLCRGAVGLLSDFLQESIAQVIERAGRTVDQVAKSSKTRCRAWRVSGSGGIADPFHKIVVFQWLGLGRSAAVARPASHGGLEAAGNSHLGQHRRGMGNSTPSALSPALAPPARADRADPGRGGGPLSPARAASYDPGAGRIWILTKIEALRLDRKPILRKNRNISGFQQGSGEGARDRRSNLARKSAAIRRFVPMVGLKLDWIFDHLSPKVAEFLKLYPRQRRVN